MNFYVVLGILKQEYYDVDLTDYSGFETIAAMTEFEYDLNPEWLDKKAQEVEMTGDYEKVVWLKIKLDGYYIANKNKVKFNLVGVLDN